MTLGMHAVQISTSSPFLWARTNTAFSFSVLFCPHLTSFIKNSGVFYLVFRRFEMIYVKREVSRKKKKCEK